MIGSWKSLAAALALCCAAAFPSRAESYEAMVDVTRILGAALADLRVVPDSEPQRVLVVTAEVPTAGWSNGALEPVTYVTFPLDGIWDVQARAQEPEGMAAQMISKVVLAMDASGEPGELKGYRIHAAENCVVVLFDEATTLPNERCVVLGRAE
jgi:hypothetical protein